MNNSRGRRETYLSLSKPASAVSSAWATTFSKYSRLIVYAPAARFKARSRTMVLLSPRARVTVSDSVLTTSWLSLLVTVRISGSSSRATLPLLRKRHLQTDLAFGSGRHRCRSNGHGAADGLVGLDDHGQFLGKLPGAAAGRLPEGVIPDRIRPGVENVRLQRRQVRAQADGLVPGQDVERTGIVGQGQVQLQRQVAFRVVDQTRKDRDIAVGRPELRIDGQLVKQGRHFLGHFINIVAFDIFLDRVFTVHGKAQCMAAGMARTAPVKLKVLISRGRQRSDSCRLQVDIVIAEHQGRSRGGCFAIVAHPDRIGVIQIVIAPVRQLDRQIGQIAAITEPGARASRSNCPCSARRADRGGRR